MACLSEPHCLHTSDAHLRFVQTVHSACGRAQDSKNTAWFVAHWIKMLILNVNQASYLNTVLLVFYMWEPHMHRHHSICEVYKDSYSIFLIHM